MNVRSLYLRSVAVPLLYDAAAWRRNARKRFTRDRLLHLNNGRSNWLSARPLDVGSSSIYSGFYFPSSFPPQQRTFALYLHCGCYFAATETGLCLIRLAITTENTAYASQYGAATAQYLLGRPHVWT